MKDRLKTLVIDSNGAGWKYIVVDTVLRGALRLQADESVLPGRFRRHLLARRLLGDRYEHLSYVRDWRDALCAAPELDVEVCGNINNLVEYRRWRDAIASYPLIILLHSAAGDSMSLLLKTAHWFQRRRGKLVVFIGNEYDLMVEKFAFLRATGADFACSQLPIEAARWLYADCHPTQILEMPHALNPRIYYPDGQDRRPLDIGFSGDIYYYFVGDMERTRLVRFFERHGAEFGLVTELRLNKRMPRREWARFLNRCTGTIGAESGSYYLDRQGDLIRSAKAYSKRHPRASFEEIFERFFRFPMQTYVSGKSISSRHFEPIGTKTCQVLLDGHYNGILQPEQHYIRVKKDLSDIDEAIRRFKDDSYRTSIVERAYEFVTEEHTYQHRIRSLLSAVA